MGGCGSGRWGWYRRKSTVEGTWILDIDTLIRAGLLNHQSGVIELTHPSGVQNRLRHLLGDAGTDRDTDTRTRLILDLLYTLATRWQSEDRYQRVTLVAKPQRLGGVRWYFSCPLSCTRLARKLYSIFGKGFGCRLCQNLTYASCQEHDSRCDVWRHNPEALGAAIKAYSLRAMGFFLAQERRRERKLLALRGVTITPIA